MQGTARRMGDKVNQQQKESHEKILLYPGEDGWWVAEYPSLPGTVTQGGTKEEATRNIREAIDLMVSVLQEHGEVIPDYLDAAELVTGLVPPYPSIIPRTSIFLVTAAAFSAPRCSRSSVIAQGVRPYCSNPRVAHFDMCYTLCCVLHNITKWRRTYDNACNRTEHPGEH